MPTTRIIYPRAICTGQRLILFHGDGRACGSDLERSDIECRKGTDFGRAVTRPFCWSRRILGSTGCSNNAGANLAVAEIVVSRKRVAGLQTLPFARGRVSCE